MTRTQLEEKLTSESLSTWERLRSSTELKSFIDRHASVLETLDNSELIEEF